MRKLILIIILTFLASCGNTPAIVPIIVEPITFHPARPSPVRALPKNQWTFISITENGVESGFYALPNDDAVDLLKYLEDVTRYLKGQNVLLCYYRDKDLLEPQCID